MIVHTYTCQQIICSSEGQRKPYTSTTVRLVLRVRVATIAVIWRQAAAAAAGEERLHATHTSTGCTRSLADKHYYLGPGLETPGPYQACMTYYLPLGL